MNRKHVLASLIIAACARPCLDHGARKRGWRDGQEPGRQ